MPKRNFFSQATRPENEDRLHTVEALLDERTTTARDLPITRIQPNPFQARRTFDDIDALAQAIRLHGFTSRLRVRPHPTERGMFQLVFGERRLRAAIAAGLTEIPCDIAEHTDDELIEIGLAENIQRRDLDPLEEAQAFQTFIAQRNYSIRKLAERIGKDKGYVEGRLALLRAPEDVQQLVAERPDTIDAARQIARLATPAERQPLIARVADGTLSGRDVRAIVREAVAASTDMVDPSARPQPAMHTPPADILQAAIAKDLQRMRTILARWRELQNHGEEQSRIIVAAARTLAREIDDL